MRLPRSLEAIGTPHFAGRKAEAPRGGGDVSQDSHPGLLTNGFQEEPLVGVSSSLRHQVLLYTMPEKAVAESSANPWQPSGIKCADQGC